MTTELYRSPTRTSQDVLGAGPLDTVFPPAGFPFGQILYLRDVRRFYMRVGRPTSDVAAWELLGGPGASLAWPKYVVDVSGQQPVAAYTSVQAAIDAAVADGHTTTNPTVVHVFPGTYVEDVTFRPGIYVVGFDNSSPSQAIIRGAHTVPGNVANGGYKILDIVLSGTPGNVVLTIAGTQASTVEMWDWQIAADGASAVRITNTGGTVVTFVDGAALWINAPLGGALIDIPVGASAFMQGFRAFLIADPFNDIAVRNDAGAPMQLEHATVQGRLTIAGGQLQADISNFFAFNQPCISASGGAQVSVSFSMIGHASGGGPWFDTLAGGAFLTTNANQFFQDRIVDPATTQQSSYFAYSRISQLNVGGITLTQAVDGVAIDTNGVASPVVLPDLGTVPLGHELWVKWARNAGGSVSVAPAAGNNIDDAAAAVFLAGLGASLRFAADQAHNTWWMVQ